ncbi:MAG: UDP-2,3-diacylglucosamine diphosphatase [Oligoflexus sp.]
MQSIRADALIASDIHLTDLDDKKGRLLLQVLDQVAQSEVGHLIFLGDIFDFCLGSHSFYQKKYKALGDALERCAASGTKVIYIEGNHEFRLRDFAWQGVEFFNSDTTYVKLDAGHVLQLGHGDLIFSHNRYKAFRRVVKSKAFTGAAGLLPGRLMDWIARKAAETSRAQDAYRTIHHDRILSAAYHWLEKGDGDFGLFGHFHVPYAEARRDGKQGGIFSMNCWDEPNFLMVRDGQFFRLHPETETQGLATSETAANWSMKLARSYFADPAYQEEKPHFVPAMALV